jgi:predicted naringenin-chalcone synthase
VTDRPVVLSSIASAFPAAVTQSELWDGYFSAHYGNNRVARRVWTAAGVTTRHGAVDPRTDDPSSWSTGRRMLRYRDEAMPLGKDVVTAALADAGLDAADVGMFAVVSCTGYVTPGLDILLARDLGMPADVRRLVIGHMGCYAALPGLASVQEYVAARGRPAVLLCLELTSLHVQPPLTLASGGLPTPEQTEQIVAHALFSDGAAAAVIRPGDADGGGAGGAWTGPSGLDVVDVVCRTDVTTSDLMTWDVTDLGFRMGLSAEVPDVLARHVEGVVDELLHAHGLDRDDVDGWAVHPGGPRILKVVAERLGLAAGALDASWEVLAEHGNCSSPTVLLVLDQLLRTRPVPDGGHVVALAFGPGLTLYAALLRVRGS